MIYVSNRREIGVVNGDDMIEIDVFSEAENDIFSLLMSDAL